MDLEVEVSSSGILMDLRKLKASIDSLATWQVLAHFDYNKKVILCHLDHSIVKYYDMSIKKTLVLIIYESSFFPTY